MKVDKQSSLGAEGTLGNYAGPRDLKFQKLFQEELYARHTNAFGPVDSCETRMLKIIDPFIQDTNRNRTTQKATLIGIHFSLQKKGIP